MLYIHIMYLFNMLLHYIICYYYYEIGNKLSYPILTLIYNIFRDAAGLNHGLMHKRTLYT